jgi:hypothetical protein
MQLLSVERQFARHTPELTVADNKDSPDDSKEDFDSGNDKFYQAPDDENN